MLSHRKLLYQQLSSYFLHNGLIKSGLIFRYIKKTYQQCFLVGLAAWIYQQAIQPPPPKICGSPGGPAVASSRIKLKDGRHLAYLEAGVPKEKANFNIVFVHGFYS